MTNCYQQLSSKSLNIWLNGRVELGRGLMSLTDFKNLRLAHTILKATGWASREKHAYWGAILSSRAFPCPRQECSQSHRVIFDDIGPPSMHFNFFFCSGRVVTAEYTYTNYPNSFERYLTDLTVAPDSPAELSQAKWMAFVIIKTSEARGGAPR